MIAGGDPACGEMNDSGLPWARLSEGARVLTVDEVERRLQTLPAHRLRGLGLEVDAPREAGILVPVLDLGGEAGVVITRRPDTMIYHRGDWVFPGGRVTTADATVADAARREACEELGIPEDRLRVVGQLDSYGPISTGFVIHTFVGVAAPGTTLAPDPSEVAEVRTMSISTLLDPAIVSRGGPMPDHEPGPLAVRLADTTPRAAPPEGYRTALLSFHLGLADVLWGTQADILFNFLSLLTAAR